MSRVRDIFITDPDTGDQVTATFAGITRDYHIMAAMTTVQGGRESIKLVLEER